MARKKKARLTLKKKADKKADKQAPGGMSERKFAALPHEYGSFMGELKLSHCGHDTMTDLHTVEDPDHEQHEFRKEDVYATLFMSARLI